MLRAVPIGVCICLVSCSGDRHAAAASTSVGIKEIPHKDQCMHVANVRARRPSGHTADPSPNSQHIYPLLLLMPYRQPCMHMRIEHIPLAHLPAPFTLVSHDQMIDPIREPGF